MPRAAPRIALWTQSDRRGARGWQRTQAAARARPTRRHGAAASRARIHLERPPNRRARPTSTDAGRDHAVEAGGSRNAAPRSRRGIVVASSLTSPNRRLPRGFASQQKLRSGPRTQSGTQWARPTARSGEQKTATPSGLSSGETRTRTGDTRFSVVRSNPSRRAKLLEGTRLQAGYSIDRCPQFADTCRTLWDWLAPQAQTTCGGVAASGPSLPDLTGPRPRWPPRSFPRGSGRRSRPRDRRATRVRLCDREGDRLLARGLMLSRRRLAVPGPRRYALVAFAPART